MTAPVQIVRYGGSRLYDAAAGRYVSAAELRRWASAARRFQVRDATTQEDVTQLYAAA